MGQLRHDHHPHQRHRQLWQYLPRVYVIPSPGRLGSTTCLVCTWYRRTFRGRRVRSERILFRVSIHERPAHINDRSVFGHWESDSIVGAKTVGEGIHTEVEPVSRFIIARKTNALTVEWGAQHSTRSSMPCLLARGCL